MMREFVNAEYFLHEQSLAVQTPFSIYLPNKFIAAFASVIFTSQTEKKCKDNSN